MSLFNLFFKNQIQINNLIIINSSESSKSYDKIAKVTEKFKEHKLIRIQINIFFIFKK